MKKAIAHYVRVSTAQQNTERQKSIVIGAKVYEDKCSGTIPFKNRESGSQLIEDIEEKLIKEVHVHSIDRLGRNTLDIMQTIQYMTAKGVNVVSVKEGMQTLNADGTENMVSKLMVGILGTLAEFERERMKERRMEGIAIAKERDAFKGNGRPKNTEESVSDFMQKAKSKKIVKCLKQNRSLRETAAICGCSLGLVQKVKSYLEFIEDEQNTNKVQREKLPSGYDHLED